MRPGRAPSSDAYSSSNEASSSSLCRTRRPKSTPTAVSAITQRSAAPTATTLPKSRPAKSRHEFACCMSATPAANITESITPMALSSLAPLRDASQAAPPAVSKAATSAPR